MEQYPTIRLMQGATSVVEIDLTGFDFQGGSVVFTMCDRWTKESVLACEMTEPIVNYIEFKDEFTATLKTGKSNYEYDIMWHIGEERFAQCAPTPVEVSHTVGGWSRGADD
jgi:hypothetical protein